jgi:hypothetical protein
MQALLQMPAEAWCGAGKALLLLDLLSRPLYHGFIVTTMFVKPAHPAVSNS